jgi:signal transduction histidine kinase
MFRTLRAKLFLTYAAIAVLTLMLALVVTFILARDYARRDGFMTLQEKKALALPYTQVVIASELRGVPAQDQRPNTPRQLLARSARESMRNSGLRLLLVDPETRLVTEDTASPFDATGKAFPLADTEPGFAQQLNNTGVQGTMSFQGEGVTYQYIAQRIRLNLLRAGAEPLFSIVVFAQPEPPRLEGLFREIIWYVITAVAVALLLSLAAAYILARSISRPVAQLGSAATAMSRGDFTQRVPVRGRDELAELSRQFNEMAQEVGNAHQMERDFIANVSHDLKTPLTSIVGFSQAILDGAANDEASVSQAASIINREAQSLDRLVGRLVSLSRLEAGLKQIELRPVDLKPLLGNLVLAFQPQAERAGIDLSCSLDRESRLVLADAEQLKEAVNNLVENAIKYSASGGKVAVELRQEKAQINIIVRDTGRGIPRDDLPRVMERFYQVDKARSNSADRSIGLGLAIASEVVRAHQGRIDIDSTEGVGTVVTISLPTATADS